MIYYSKSSGILSVEEAKNMSLSRTEREKIELDLLKQIYSNTLVISEIAARHQVSRQTVYRYLRELVDKRIIHKSNSGNFFLFNQVFRKDYKNTALDEDPIWRNDIAPFFADIPQKAFKKVQYIFTEIMNNAIEHSESKDIRVTLVKTHINLVMVIADNGIGIFKKIQTAFDLQEKSFAILELSKGKLTTDPERHTGEGIFFSSRIADIFHIASDELTLISKSSDDIKDTLYTDDQTIPFGTIVGATIYFDNDTAINEVFRAFTEHPEHISFNATHVPVRLLEYGAESPIFVSRSEARRLLSHFERFRRVTLDFAGVEEIYQGFADEVFRVFTNKHPECKIEAINCNEQVLSMIEHVKRTE
jgi:anti-sigma regulatory factor (Ser/Thr protein kinase)/DNA-binding CsgD family transcriptional regulator